MEKSIIEKKKFSEWKIRFVETSKNGWREIHTLSEGGIDSFIILEWNKEREFKVDLEIPFPYMIFCGFQTMTEMKVIKKIENGVLRTFEAMAEEVYNKEEDWGFRFAVKNIDQAMMILERMKNYIPLLMFLQKL